MLLLNQMASVADDILLLLLPGRFFETRETTDLLGCRYRAACVHVQSILPDES